MRRKSTGLYNSEPVSQTSNGTNWLVVNYNLHWSFGTVDQINAVGCCCDIYQMMGLVTEPWGPVFVLGLLSHKSTRAGNLGSAGGWKKRICSSRAVDVTVDTVAYLNGTSAILSASSASSWIDADSRVEARTTCVLKGNCCKKSCLKIFSGRVSSPRSCFIRRRICDGVLLPNSSNMRSWPSQFC